MTQIYLYMCYSREAEWSRDRVSWYEIQSCITKSGPKFFSLFFYIFSAFRVAFLPTPGALPT